MADDTKRKRIDLTPYAGRWVALVRGRVTGVGWTAREARRAAKRSRPKEEPEVVFVSATETSAMSNADPESTGGPPSP